MFYSASLTPVYNYYKTGYASTSTSRYDTHKRSELQNIYHSIVNLNKESPLYILDTSRASREFAVGLKENARQLRNTIASLGGLNETEMFNKKVAYSSNEDVVSASFIGEVPEDGNVPSFNIEVLSLASNQVNLGSFLPSDEKCALPANAYSFDVTINDLGYEFQYNVRENETNRNLQDRLSRLINNSGIGIHADILEDGKGNSSLRLTPDSTGAGYRRDHIFTISDGKTAKASGTVDYLGIDFIARSPSNAEFLLDGEHRSAVSNHFTIHKMYALNLNGVSANEGEGTTIGVKADLDSLTENIGQLVTGYNSFIRSASEYLNLHPKSRKLLNEMREMSSLYRPSLEPLGFSFEKDGEISLSDDAFKDSISENDFHGQLSSIRNFTNSVLRKTGQISLNPMEYVDRVMVAYKNPGRNFATPYVTSNYSGMLFNGYC